MKRRIALAAHLAALLCLGAFAGSALADNGQKPSEPPGKSGDAPGQEKKAEQPAPPPAPPQPAPVQPQQPAPAATAQQSAPAGQGKPESKPDKPAKPQQAADKPAKVDKPAKTQPAKTQPSSVGTVQSAGNGRSDEAHHHVIICHRTGSDSNPYVVINIPLTAWHGGHTTHPPLNGRSDILLKDPASRPGSKDGFTKEDCEAAAGVTTTTGTTTSGTTTTGTTTTSSTTSSSTTTSSSSTTASSTTTTTAGAAAVAGSSSGSGPSAAGGSQPTSGVAGAVERAVGKPLGGVLGAGGQLGRAAVKGTLPFTGVPLWAVALVAVTLIGFGLALRRRSAYGTNL